MPELAQWMSEGPLVYLIVAALVMTDAVFPLAPSESLLVAGGIAVTSGEVLLVPLVAAGAIGALAGHAVLYWLGRSSESLVRKRFLRGRSGVARAAATTGRELRKRPSMLIVADFVPWGRTVSMFAAGTFGLKWKRFVVYAGIGAVIWATAFTAVGLLGSTLFESTWQSLAFSLGVIAAVAVAGELIRRRKPDQDVSPIPASTFAGPTEDPNQAQPGVSLAA